MLLWFEQPFLTSLFGSVMFRNEISIAGAFLSRSQRAQTLRHGQNNHGQLSYSMLLNSNTKRSRPTKLLPSFELDYIRRSSRMANVWDSCNHLPFPPSLRQFLSSLGSLSSSLRRCPLHSRISDRSDLAFRWITTIRFNDDYFNHSHWFCLNLSATYVGFR